MAQVLTESICIDKPQVNSFYFSLLNCESVIGKTQEI